MTDLERARVHLQDCQEWLADVRAAPFVLAQGLYLGKAENAVLAALSWVWEEQEKAADIELNEWWMLQCTGHRRLHGLPHATIRARDAGGSG